MKIQLTTATPLHIGNGRSLSPYTDFVVGNDGKVYLIDSQKLNDQLVAVGDEAVDEYVSQIMGCRQPGGVFSLKQFLEKYKIDYRQIAKFVWETHAPIQNETIQETIKSTSKPYIPGSSIKGAIRTALLYFHRKEEGYSWEAAIKDIFGKGVKKSPNGEDIFGRYQNDVLRHLHVSDSSPLPSEEVGLVKTVRYNLVKKEASIPVTKEVIPENKILDFRLQCKAEKIHQLPPRFNYLYRDKDHTGERQILSLVNRFYLQLLEEELAVLKRTQSKQLDPIKRLYERLFKTAKEYELEQSGAVIRLGSGKTFLENTIISLFSYEERRQLIKKLKKGGGPYFPKTRAVIDNGVIYEFVLGWAYLEPVMS